MTTPLARPWAPRENRALLHLLANSRKKIIIKKYKKRTFVGMKERRNRKTREKDGRGEGCLQFLTNERRATSCHVS